MGLRKVLTPFQRLGRGRLFGARVFGGGITASATAIGLLTAAGTGLTITLPVLAGVSGACLVAGVIGAYLKGKAVQIPLNLVDPPPVDQKYVATFCTAASLREADELTQPYYGDQYVPPSVAEEWRAANQFGFVHLTNAKGEMCSSFSVLGLEASFLNQFIKGRVTDTQIRGGDILSFDRTKQSKHVYIGGVVVRGPESMVGHKRTAAMLWAMTEYFRLLLGPRKTRTVYALSVNKSSENLLTRLGFTNVSPISGGKDHKLFSLRMDAETRKAIATMVGDCAAYCVCDFASAKQGTSTTKKRRP